MISKTIIFIFGFLAAIVAGQEATPESGRLLAKGSKGGKSGKSGKARRLLAKGTSGKGSKASKGGCGPDRFTGVYNYVAPYGTPYQVTFATRL